MPLAMRYALNWIPPNALIKALHPVGLVTQTATN